MTDRKFDRDRLRQWLNLAAILAAFVTNVLANLVPFQGLTIGEISNKFFQNLLITPASYAFAIWGLIYLGLISLAIYQALPAQKTDPYLRRLSYSLVLSSLAQIIWVLLFQARWFALSLLAMVAILLPLLSLYLRLGIAFTPASPQQRWLVCRPVSLYLAWICVATIVNVAIALYAADWQHWGISPLVWTVILLAVAVLLAVTVAIRRQDLVYLGVFVWALVAIAVRHSDLLPLVATAGTGAGILVAIAAIRFRLGGLR